LKLTGIKPHIKTTLGFAYQGDTRDLIKRMPDESVNLIMTSPPFALQRKKEYGNVSPDEYVDWFINSFYHDFHRVLKRNGSLVIDIGGSWVKGSPVKSLYNYNLLLEMCRERKIANKKHKFHLAQDFFWHNPSKLPSPAEWVTVRRIRVKDSVNTVWWLSKTETPNASNRNVLVPYSDSMKHLLKNGYTPRTRPSGHQISDNFNTEHGGAIPPNLLSIANTESNSYYLRRCKDENIKPHPARFPVGLPEFFIKFLTKPNELVFDPFAGSCVTGEAAQLHNRRWICFELSGEYLDGAKFRFEARRVTKKETDKYSQSLFK